MQRKSEKLGQSGWKEREHPPAPIETYSAKGLRRKRIGRNGALIMERNLAVWQDKAELGEAGSGWSSGERQRTDPKPGEAAPASTSRRCHLLNNKD